LSRVSLVKGIANLFHAGIGPPLALKPLTHFGTEKAALSVLLSRLVGKMGPNPELLSLIEGELKASNPVKMIDSVKAHSLPSHLLEDIEAAGQFHEPNLLKYLRKKESEGDMVDAIQTLTQRLHKSGFDAISYANRAEDKGSTSLISLFEDQFVPKKVTQGKDELMSLLTRVQPVLEDPAVVTPQVALKAKSLFKGGK